MFWPWVFKHLLVINPNRNSVLVPPLIIYSLPVPPSNRWWPCSGSHPPAAPGVLLSSLSSCPWGVWWPRLSVSLFPPTRHLFSPLSPFTPRQLMDCLAPPLPSLSPSLSLKQRGEKRRDERLGKRKEWRQQPTVPLGPCLSAAPVAQYLPHKLQDPVVQIAGEENESRLRSPWLAGLCARWPRLCPWCSAWQRELGSAAPGPVAAPSPCSSAWKRPASTASRCWHSRRVRTSQKCESGLGACYWQVWGSRYVYNAWLAWWKQMKVSNAFPVRVHHGHSSFWSFFVTIRGPLWMSLYCMESFVNSCMNTGKFVSQSSDFRRKLNQSHGMNTF